MAKPVGKKYLVGVRYVVVKEHVYLRSEDVAAYLRELAAAEETDVRNRINTAADNLTA